MEEENDIQPKTLAKIIYDFIVNKYSVVLVIFLVWMFFFDTNSILVHYKIDQEINNLNAKIKHYEIQLNEDSITFNKLKYSKDAREKYARENYFMKKSNEDIFIVVHKKDSIKFK